MTTYGSTTENTLEKEGEEMATVVDQTLEYENYFTDTIGPIKKTAIFLSLPGELDGTEDTVGRHILF